MDSGLLQRLRSMAAVVTAAEAAVPTEVGAAAFMEAAEADRTAVGECLAEAARLGVAASAGAAILTEAAGPMVAADLRAQVSLNAAAANRAVRPRDVRARWDVQAAVQAARAARRQVMPAARMDLAEAVPAARAPRAAQATVLRMASGIHSAELVAAQDPQAARQPPDGVARPAGIFTPSAEPLAERVA